MLEPLGHHLLGCFTSPGANFGPLFLLSPSENILADVLQLHAACHQMGIRTVALPIPQSKVLYAREFQAAALQWKAYNKLLREWAAKNSDMYACVAAWSYSSKPVVLN